MGGANTVIMLLHDPGIWALAALGTFLPIAAAIAALSMAVQGSVLAIVLIGVSLVLGEVRYHCRRRIVIALWGEATAAGLPMYWRVERWLRPIWWSFHALCVFSALGSRHIRWAGIDYLGSRAAGCRSVEAAGRTALEERSPLE